MGREGDERGKTEGGRGGRERGKEGGGRGQEQWREGEKEKQGGSVR